jgi:heme oxygenase
MDPTPANITELSPYVLARIVSIVDSTEPPEPYLDELLWSVKVNEDTREFIEECGGQLRFLTLLVQYLKSKELLNDLPQLEDSSTVVEEDASEAMDMVDMMAARNW